MKLHFTKAFCGVLTWNTYFTSTGSYTHSVTLYRPLFPPALNWTIMLSFTLTLVHHFARRIDTFSFDFVYIEIDFVTLAFVWNPGSHF